MGTTVRVDAAVVDLGLETVGLASMRFKDKPKSGQTGTLLLAYPVFPKRKSKSGRNTL